MARAAVNVAGEMAWVSFDNPPLNAMRWSGLASLQLIDEQSQEPIRESVQLEIENDPRGRLVPRVSRDGIVGVVGRPWDLISTPALLDPAVAPEIRIQLTLRVPGYAGRRHTARVQMRRLTLALAAGSVLTLTTPATGVTVGQRLLLGPLANAEFVTVVEVLGPNQLRIGGPPVNPHLPGDFVVPDEISGGGVTRLELHRDPTWITGRVVQNTGGAPIANMQIWADRVARITPRVSQPFNAILPVNPLLAPLTNLQTPSYRDYPLAGTQIVIENRAVNVAVPPKRLLTAVAAGTRDLLVSDRIGLGAPPPEILSLNQGSPHAEELMEIESIDTTGSSAGPTRITLVHPLRRSHGAGAVIRVLGPALGPAIRSLSDAIAENDTAVLLDMTGQQGMRQIQIRTGPLAPPRGRSFHRATPLTALTDVNGEYRMRISRAGAVSVVPVLEAPPGTFTQLAVFPQPVPPPVPPPPVPFELDYSGSGNRMDFRVMP